MLLHGGRKARHYDTRPTHSIVVASPCGRHAHPSTLAAKMDSVGQWYLGRKNRMSRRFSSDVRSLAPHVERKMTLVVPVVPLANRVKM